MGLIFECIYHIPKYAIMRKLNKGQIIVKTHRRLVNLESFSEILPHNLIRQKMGYEWLGIMDCQTRFNEDLNHNCHIKRESEIFNWVWVDNFDEYPDVKQDKILVLESTNFGYHIIDCRDAENPCHYSLK